MTIPDDELRRLLHEAADAAPVDTAALQDDLAATLDRARRARTTRTVTASAVGVVLLGGVAWTAAAQPWNPPAPEPEPTVTVTPSETPSATAEPTPTETTAPTPSPTATPEPPPAPEGSDVAYPACGEVLALPERVPQLSLELEGDLVERWSPDGGGASWVEGAATVTNHGVTEVSGTQDLAVYLVLLDGDGRVAASSANPESPAPEGYSLLALSPGDSASREASVSQGCAGASNDPTRLVEPGDYQVVALMNVYGDDGSIVQQAQGGTWPFTVGDRPSDPRGPQIPPTLAGAAPMGEGCGFLFDPRPDTVLTVEAAEIRSPRAADDGVDELVLTVTTTDPLAAQRAFPTVLLTRDGVLVNHVPATDAIASLTMSAGTSLVLETGADLIDCAYEPLAPGTYEAHPVLMDLSADGLVVLARAPAQEVVIE